MGATPYSEAEEDMSAQQRETFEETPVPVPQFIDVAFTDQTEDYLEAEVRIEAERERAARLAEDAEARGA